MAQADFSNIELIKKGWGATKSNVVILLKIALVFILVSIVVNLIDIASSHNPGIVGLVGIFNTVISTILEIGLITIGLSIVDGKTPKFEDLYSHYNRFLEFFLTSLLMGVIVVIGFILLIIPGIYFMVKYQFTLFNVVDKKLAYMKALNASSEMVKGRWMRVFMFDLGLIGLNILGLLALGVGLLITIPTSFFAGLYLYRRLSN